MPYTDSDTMEGTLEIQGVWIHDPDDAEGTATHYLYGKAMRATNLAVESSATLYAGREFAVVDFGETTTQQHPITLHVPFGTDWWAKLEALREFVLARKTLFLKDNRGRAVYGVPSGYTEDDQEWGTAVSFTWSRVNYTEDTVTV